MKFIHLLIRAEVAQLVEHLTENQGVTSSILVLGIEQIGTLRGAFFGPFRPYVSKVVLIES